MCVTKTVFFFWVSNNIFHYALNYNKNKSLRFFRNFLCKFRTSYQSISLEEGKINQRTNCGWKKNLLNLNVIYKTWKFDIADVKEKEEMKLSYVRKKKMPKYMREWNKKKTKRRRKKTNTAADFLEASYYYSKIICGIILSEQALLNDQIIQKLSYKIRSNL